VSSNHVVTLAGDWTVAHARQWIDSSIDGTRHQGYPIVAAEGHLLGILTRRDLLNPAHRPEQSLGELIHRPPVIVYPDVTLRDAADHMANHDIGRLPVIDRNTARIIGMITRSDVLSAHRRKLPISQEG
jgi:CBS domain-containing protein